MHLFITKLGKVWLSLKQMIKINGVWFLEFCDYLLVGTCKCFSTPVLKVQYSTMPCNAISRPSTLYICLGYFTKIII